MARPQLRWSFSSLGCPDLDLEGVFSIARRFGLEWVELRALGGGVDLPAWFAAHLGTPADFARAVENSGVRIASLDTSFHLSDEADAAREALLAFLPWAEALGGVPLRIFDGAGAGGTDPAGAVVKNLNWWDEARRKAGWRSSWVIETHDSVFTAESIEALMARVPDSVGLLWDSHHTWKKGGEDPLQTWGAIQRHVRHVHVKDSVSHPSARHPFTYVNPGAGEYPLKAVLDRLAADGFDGPVSLEWEKMWHPYLPPLETALQIAADRGWLAKA